MAPSPSSGGTVIQFTYKLKVNEGVHPRYNPEKDDRWMAGMSITSGFGGNCSSSDTPGMLDE
jgi:hypothetical protein